MEIQFIGGAGQVTGTCLLLTVGGRQFLLDCGLVQGTANEQARNFQPFPFDAANIDAMILSSAHLNHSGLLPMLVSEGFRGNIYTHSRTRDQVRIILKDHGHLNERCVDAENSKRQRKGMSPRRPLYTLQESQNAMRLFSALEFGEWQHILPGVDICLYDAQYYDGASIVMIRMTEANRTRTVVYGGQIGDREGSFIGPEHEQVVDLVLLNSTFGAHIHGNREQAVLDLGDILSSESTRLGNVLIPSPTIGRTQSLLATFADHYQGWHLDHWSLYVDHLMATEARAAFELAEDAEDEALDLPNLQVTRTVNQSLGINKIDAGAIIMASTEMCSGGRIRHHLKHNVWNEKCHIILFEYQAKGTVGRQLFDAEQHIRLWGETIKVNAKIHRMYGLSGQADRDGMADWLAGFQGKPTVALVEGEKLSFQSMEQKVQQMGKSRVIIPGQGVILDLG